ncbi:MAG: hypothetical protein NUV67_04635 [archaeon]|nr:hypothetical protein [archaeon]
MKKLMAGILLLMLVGNVAAIETAGITSEEYVEAQNSLDLSGAEKQQVTLEIGVTAQVFELELLLEDIRYAQTLVETDNQEKYALIVWGFGEGSTKFIALGKDEMPIQNNGTISIAQGELEQIPGENNYSYLLRVDKIGEENVVVTAYKKKTLDDSKDPTEPNPDVSKEVTIYLGKSDEVGDLVILLKDIVLLKSLPVQEQAHIVYGIAPEGLDKPLGEAYLSEEDSILVKNYVVKVKEIGENYAVLTVTMYKAPSVTGSGTTDYEGKKIAIEESSTSQAPFVIGSGTVTEVRMDDNGKLIVKGDAQTIAPMMSEKRAIKIEYLENSEIKGIEITPMSDKRIITVTTGSASGEASVVMETKEEFSATQDGMSLNKKKISVLPQVAVDKAISSQQLNAQVSNVELVDNGKPGEEKPVYVVLGKKNVKILWVIDAEMDVKTEINAQTSEVEKVEKPFWNILTTG